MILRLLGHPVMNREIGIEFTNGSLGMGLSLGTGVAIGLSKKKLNTKVYVLLGDGSVTRDQTGKQLC